MISRRVSRWWLPLSLSVNVFLAALIAAHFLFRPSGPPPPPPPPEWIVERIAESLPPADGEVLRQAFARHAHDLENAHQMGRKNIDQILAALTAPTFDADALRALFAQGHVERDRMENIVEEIVVEAVGAMSVEGRQKLPQWFPPPPPPQR